MNHMSNQKKYDISLSFQQEKEEEITSVFLIEDLIKEYNNRVIASPPFLKKYPLSLRPLNTHSNDAIIRPMTKEEIHSIRSYELDSGDWFRLKKILEDQVSPTGLLSNIPNIAAGVTIMEVLNELSLTGKVDYKTVGDKTYVILKGCARQRHILKGTRYLNTNPQITGFGLAKVSVKDAFKTGFKTSILIYGSIKAVDAVDIYLEKGELDSSFFFKVGTDIPKLTISTLVSAAAGGVVAAAGLPVAVGMGIVLVVGCGTGIALEFFDQKIGLTEKLSEAAETMWMNLKKSWSTPSKTQEKLSMHSNLLEGLIFQTPFLRHPQVIQKGELFLYTV